MTDGRDPGWRVFGAAGPNSPPLIRLRLAFTTFVLALVTFLVTLSFLVDPEHRWRGNLEPDWASWILYAAAAASLLGAAWARGRPLSGPTSRALLGSYNTRFFIGIASAESAALVAFALVFLTQRLWPYLVGLAPTERNIERDEEHLRAAGSPASLWDALTQPPDRSAPGTP